LFFSITVKQLSQPWRFLILQFLFQFLGNRLNLAGIHLEAEIRRLQTPELTGHSAQFSSEVA